MYDQDDAYPQNGSRFSAFHYAVERLKMAEMYNPRQSSHVFRAGAVALFLLSKVEKTTDFSKLDKHLYKYRLDKPSTKGPDIYDRRPYLDHVEKMYDHLRDDSFFYNEQKQDYRVNILDRMVDRDEKEYFLWKGYTPSIAVDFAKLLHPDDKNDVEANRFKQILGHYVSKGGGCDKNPDYSLMYPIIRDVVGPDKGESSAFQYLTLIAYTMRTVSHEIPLSMHEAADILEEAAQKRNQQLLEEQRQKKNYRIFLAGLGICLASALFMKECSGDITEKKAPVKTETVQPPVHEQEKTSPIYRMPNGQEVIKP